jgi:hypothetical protein
MYDSNPEKGQGQSIQCRRDILSAARSRMGIYQCFYSIHLASYTNSAANKHVYGPAKHAR